MKFVTAQQYRDAIEHMGLNQVQAAKFFDVTERTSRNWAANGAPTVVHMLLRIMTTRRISVAHVNKLMGRKPFES
jgi:hypothetical protein